MKKTLVQAPTNQEFWVDQGPVLRNLQELKNFLGVIKKETFDYHTKHGHNDFALWVDAVLKDEVAGKAIAKAKTIVATLKAVETALKKYNLPK